MAAQATDTAASVRGQRIAKVPEPTAHGRRLVTQLVEGTVAAVDLGNRKRVASGAVIVDSANQTLLDRQTFRLSGKLPQIEVCASNFLNTSTSLRLSSAKPGPGGSVDHQRGVRGDDGGGSFA